MIRDSSFKVHITFVLYKTQRHGSLYLSRDKQFQYVAPYNVKMTLSLTERKTGEPR
jgi:hypothetical protein